MKQISLTVPMDKNALTRAAEMLQGLASDLGGESVPKSTPAAIAPAPDAQTLTTSATPAPTATDAVTSGTSNEPAATEVFGGAPSPSLFAEQPAVDPKPAPTTATVPGGAGETSTEAIVDATTESTQAGNGVDLAPATTNPEISIPWDARIHAGSKAKLAKKPHGWKMKRGVDDALVQQVEAELIQAMQAGPANPVGNAAPAAVTSTETQTSAPAPAPAPVNAAQPASPAPAPAQPAAPAAAVTTFPELMAKITASGIDQATVTAAVNKQGLQALPLLAARPDLIPAVATELGFGG